MFYCYVRYYRYIKRPNSEEKIIEQFNVGADDERTIRKVGCALSGLLKKMDIEHDVEFVYKPYDIKRGAEDNDRRKDHAEAGRVSRLQDDGIEQPGRDGD